MPDETATLTNVGETSRSSTRSDSFRLARAMTLVLLISTFNAPGINFVGNPIWYVCVVIPVLVVVGMRALAPSTLIRRPGASDRVLIVLLVVGMAGTLYGMVFADTSASARPIFIPMIVALLPLAALDAPTDQEVESVLRALIWIGIAYWTLNALIYAGGLPGALLGDDHPFRNSQLLYVAMAITAATLFRKWVVVTILAVLAGFMFLVYPSATSVLVAGATVVTLFATGSRASMARPLVTGAAILAIGVVGVLNITETVRVSDAYFLTVGKADTSYTRLLVWREAIARFERSPVVGSAFAGDINATIHRTERSPANHLPFHSDYLMFLAEGGVVGLGLLLAWIFSTEVIVLRRYRQWVMVGDRARTALLRTLLVGFNAFLVAAAFNPQFSSVSGSAAIFAIYALMMLVGSPRSPAAT